VVGVEADGEALGFPLPRVEAADGTVWDGATGRSDDGRTLDRLASRRLFAFAWQDDHGEGAFWSPA
jgi:hypothetical protein